MAISVVAAAMVRVRYLLLLQMLITGLFSRRVQSMGFGINYGRIANNLPSPASVAVFVESLNVTRVKLYDANENVISAFANSAVEFVIAIDNEQLLSMTDAGQARAWVQKYVQPYISQTKIKCITVGNEVLTGNNTQLMSFLAPAMQNVYAALGNLRLGSEISVTTAHSTGILSTSFPPSAGAFSEDLTNYLNNILAFHSQTGSPFLINAYPFFAYIGSPDQIPLNYVLFQPNSGTTDPGTNLHYDNMLYAQIDAVYAAIRRLGYTNVQVKISETGWPSKGDPNEIGATPENARLYNGNLLMRINQKQGTPANPSMPVDAFIFALFNEDLKAGPTSERNYGLFYPNGTPVYNIGLQGSLPIMSYSDSVKNVIFIFNIILPIVSLIYYL